MHPTPDAPAGANDPARPNRRPDHLAELLRRDRQAVAVALAQMREEFASRAKAFRELISYCGGKAGKRPSAQVKAAVTRIENAVKAARDAKADRDVIFAELINGLLRVCVFEELREIAQILEESIAPRLQVGTPPPRTQP